MKKYININVMILFVLCIATTFIGCIKDGLVECPEGNVRINFYVEQFQNSSQDPLANRERIFTDRVRQIRYFLYKDGVLIQNEVLQIPESANAYYPFTFNGVGYGNYQMVVVANSTRNALNGNPVDVNNLVLRYPGFAETEDYFTAVFPFTINSNDKQEFDVGLLRMHGVILYRFVNLPRDIANIGVDIENVSSEKWITGDYKVALNTNNLHLLNIKPNQKNLQLSTEESYVMGTFPTLTNNRSSYYMSLYRKNQDEPFLKRLISDTLNIRRNQLIEIIATYNPENQDINFEINLDTNWDDINHESYTEIK